MLEMLGGQRKAPEVLIGDRELGYYGFVKSADFITSEALAAAVGMINGTLMPQNNHAGWLKFAYKGKILYIAKKPIMNNISWYQLYRQGVIYGDDTAGENYYGGAVMQSIRVMVRGKEYRVRLMTIMPSNPSPSDTSGREHKDLWTRIMKDAPAGELPRWDQFLPEDLGGSGMEDGALTWGIETTTGSPEFRGTYGGGFYTRQIQHFGSYNSYHGWRPVLELVE